MSMRRVVIVGGSLAGLRAVEQLQGDGFCGEVVVVSAEAWPPYDRPPLSKGFIAGAIGGDAVMLRHADSLEVECVRGRAVSLDVHRKQVRLADSRKIGYDGLVISTGSVPRRLPGLTPRREGVFELRTLGDAVRLRRALEARPRVVIVGAGFLGVEVASACRALGLATSMVSPLPPLATCGPTVSGLTTRILEVAGVELYLGHSVAISPESGPIGGITLDDGRRLPADAVVVAVGARPATDWLADSALPVGDGVHCTAGLRVAGHRDIVAAGDVARWPYALYGDVSVRIEHWSNASEQGAFAARALLRPDTVLTYTGVPSFWSDHFGYRLQSVGMMGLGDREEIVGERSAESGKLPRLVVAQYRGARLTGAIAYNSPGALVPLRARLLAQAQPAEPCIREALSSS